MAKVGASMQLGIKPVDQKTQKKVKMLKHFLRRKRGVFFFCSPSPFFGKNKVNRTHLDSRTKPPSVQWTIELKFVSDEGSE